MEAGNNMVFRYWVWHVVWWALDIDGCCSHIVQGIGCVGGVKHLSENLRVKPMHFAQMLNPYPIIA
jgi:hypothetical protein